MRLFFFLAALLLSFVCGQLSAPLFNLKSALTSLFLSHPKEEVFPVVENKPFVIIVPSYNNQEWVERNLLSIFSQKYDNYRVIYIDDASTDDTLSRVSEYVQSRFCSHRIQIIANQKNKGACENIYSAGMSCHPGEIALILDGDDWLSHDRVLQRLNEIYANPDTWLTYGSYIEYPSYGYTVANFARPLPKEVIKTHGVRDYTRKHWCLSHLRTFYAALVQKLHPSDLQWEGKYYDVSCDLAFMIPLVEMAGGHAKYVQDIFYVYNRATPLNDNKIRAKRQQNVAEHILNLPKYQPLSSLSSEAHYLQEIR